MLSGSHLRTLRKEPGKDAVLDARDDSSFCVFISITVVLVSFSLDELPITSSLDPSGASGRLIACDCFRNCYRKYMLCDGVPAVVRGGAKFIDGGNGGGGRGAPAEPASSDR